MPYRHTQDVLAHKRSRRNTLAVAALRLFAQRGYHATSIPMITRLARASVGTFYTYFRAKDEVLEFVFQLFAETSVRILHDAVSGTNPAAPQQLHAAVTSLVLLMTTNPSLAHIFTSLPSGVGARLEKLRRDIVANHARLFEELLAKCEPPASECALASRCCVGCIYECVRHWLELPPDRRPTPEALAAGVAAFTVRAVTAGEPNSTALP